MSEADFEKSTAEELRRVLAIVEGSSIDHTIALLCGAIIVHCFTKNVHADCLRDRMGQFLDYAIGPRGSVK